METIAQSCHIGRMGKLETYQIDLQVDEPSQHSPISIREERLQFEGRTELLFASQRRFQSFGSIVTKRDLT
jgi:hypothetical protein